MNAIYGATRRRGVRVLHRYDGEPVEGARLRWLCGLESVKGNAFEVPPEGLSPCRLCATAAGCPAAGVYFAIKGDLIKIGYSTQPGSRMRQLGALLLAVQDGDTATERTLHRVFADDRVCGEWFTPSPRLIEYIDRVKSEVDQSVRAA